MNNDRTLLANFACISNIFGVRLYCVGNLRQDWDNEPYFELTEVFSCKESDNNLLPILEEAYLCCDLETNFASKLEDYILPLALHQYKEEQQGL